MHNCVHRQESCRFSSNFSKNLFYISIHLSYTFALFCKREKERKDEKLRDIVIKKKPYSQQERKREKENERGRWEVGRLCVYLFVRQNEKERKRERVREKEINI